MHNPHTNPDPLNALAEEFVKRFRQGERPSLTEYTSKYPHLAEEIRELFPALVVMEDLGSAVGHPAGPQSGPLPEQMGDYRIVREIGRGGMGVVYEAVQESLGRHVALKILPYHSLMDPTLLERFRREARAAARLHHTNIVPVFGVGEHDGVHYYAMQYIQGQALNEVIEEVKRLRLGKGDPGLKTRNPPLNHSVANALLTGQFAAGEQKNESSKIKNGEGNTNGNERMENPQGGHVPSSFDSSFALRNNNGDSDPTTQTESQYFRRVAGLGVQVADALEYAHRQGILHRDIKPSNLLLDLSGTVWITDFGLAKDLPSSPSSVGNQDQDLTNTGDIVGTVRFMSPERIEGAWEPRSDIYSLGITLYEMLTLVPAFPESNRARLIQIVMHEEPPPLRKVDPRIPSDLETIVLKALAKEPGQRYATALELGEDLRRFLADRPIQARRTTWFEYVWRWCRRNPAVAALSGLIALLVIILGIGSVVATLLRQERDKARDFQLQAEDAKHNFNIQSHLAQVTAYRVSRQGGHRFLCLAEAAKLMALNPSEEIRGKLRHEVIAALALPDLYVDPREERPGYPAGTTWIDFDDNLEIFARSDRQGNCVVGRMDGGREMFRIPGRGNAAYPHLGGDGRFLAVTPLEGNDFLEVWNLAGPAPKFVFKSESVYRWTQVHFRPDSRQLAIPHINGAISVYDLETAQRLYFLKPQQIEREMLVALHPTEPLVAVSSYFNNLVLFRDLRTGAVLETLSLPEGATHVAWHPDGNILATAGGDVGRINFYDKATLRLTRTLEARNRGLHIAFNHAGDRLISAGWDGSLQLWDPATGQLLFTSPPITANSFRFSRDDRRIACVIQGEKVGIWQVADGRDHRVLARSSLPKTALYAAAAVHWDGRLLAVAMTDGLGFWDLASGAELDFIPIPDGVRSLLFEPSGALLMNSSFGLLRWPVHCDPVAKDSLRIGPPQRLRMPGTNNLLAQSLDGKVIGVSQRAVGRNQARAGAWILHADRPGEPIRVEAGVDVSPLSVSPDGRWVATARFWGSTINIWDAHSGQLVKSLHGAAGHAHGHFSPDGRWLATGLDRNRMRAVGTWTEGPRLGEGLMESLAFGAGGRLAALETGTGAVRLVETASGREVARLEDPNLDTVIPVLSPDATRLITLTNGTVRGIHVWDLPSLRRPLAELGLDWDFPPYAPGPEKPGKALRVSVDTTGLLLGTNAGLAAWSLAVALQPLNPEAYFQRALSFASMRRYPEAIADCNRAAALHPDWEAFVARAPAQASALNNLAWTYVVKAGSSREARIALPLAERAVQLEKFQAIYQNTLGVALYRVGRFRDAVPEFTKSLQIGAGQSDAFDLYFLAMCHHRLGDTGEAQSCFNRAVAWRKSRTKLSPEGTVQLDGFHAEAAALLGLK